MSRPRTIEASIGKWHGILTALNVDEKYLTGKHCACPICRDGVDRFRWDNKEGSGSFYCTHCGAGDGFGLVIKLFGWSFQETAKKIDSLIGNLEAEKKREVRTDAQKIASIKKILGECKKVQQNDPVWRYLNRRSGISDIPSDIKYHPSMYHTEGGAHPCMVSVMRGPDGKGVSLHRTYLTPDGNKASVEKVKKFVEGLPLNGSSVRLSRVDRRIGIAEGLESALCAGIIFETPVWAATNAKLLELWIPPEGIEEVLICADNDANFTGQSAAYNLAKRLSLKKYNVEVVVPPIEGTDFADKS